MSLNWSVKKVKDHALICFENVYRGEHLIWMTIPVGIPEITRANHTEFYRRAHEWEVKNGAQVHAMTEHGFEDVYITPQDVERHIGLGTNASRMTVKQFETRLAQPA